MLALCHACQFFLPDIRGHHVLVRSVRGVLHKSPGQPRLEATLHAGERPSCVGSEQSALTEGGLCAGQIDHGTVKEQCLLRVMDALPARSSENLGSLWQSSSRPLRLRKQLSLPNLFHKEHGCPGTQTSQGATAQTHSNSPPLEEPAVGVGVIPAARNSSVADPLETGPPLSSERHDMASTAWVMGPACVARSTGAFRPPKHVLNTMELDPLYSTPLRSEMVRFSWLGVKTVTWSGHLWCVSGSLISAGDAG